MFTFSEVHDLSRTGVDTTTDVRMVLVFPSGDAYEASKEELLNRIDKYGKENISYKNLGASYFIASEKMQDGKFKPWIRCGVTDFCLWHGDAIHHNHEDAQAHAIDVLSEKICISILKHLGISTM